VQLAAYEAARRFLYQMLVVTVCVEVTTSVDAASTISVAVVVVVVDSTVVVVAALSSVVVSITPKVETIVV